MRGAKKIKPMEPSNNIPFNKPFIIGKELEYITQAVMDNSQIAGNGPFSQRCQEWLVNQLSCQKALLTHSCTAALEMAAILCDIQAGDEVIMPSFTFVSTANAFVLRGGVPVFIDIREDSLNMDETLIEAAITPKTKAIVPVHYGGVPCAMDTIIAIANKHNLKVIEDAAQAYLSKDGDRYLGAIGDLGCLSFHETKNIISGEGGALLINDEQMSLRAEIIWEKGTNRTQFLKGEIDKYTWVDIGSSYLPSELVGAFLYAQLEQAKKIITGRSKTFQRYYTGLKPLKDQGYLQIPLSPDQLTGNGHLFYIMVSGLEERSRLTRYLKERNIDALFHYIPLHSSPAGQKLGRVYGSMKVTDDTSQRLLRLPLYYEMKTTDVDRVIEAINQFYKK